MTDTPAGAEGTTGATSRTEDMERLELEVRQYLSGLVVPDNPLSARYKGRGAHDILTDCLAAIRAPTERAETAEKRANQIAEDYAFAMNEFNLKDAEVAGLREALDAEKAASALAIRLMDKAVVLKEEARAEISTLTASHAAALEQERERAASAGERIAQLLDPKNWEDADDWIVQHGKQVAEWLRTDPDVLAALRGKGEGE